MLELCPASRRGTEIGIGICARRFTVLAVMSAKAAQRDGVATVAWSPQRLRVSARYGKALVLRDGFHPASPAPVPGRRGLGLFSDFRRGVRRCTADETGSARHRRRPPTTQVALGTCAGDPG